MTLPEAEVIKGIRIHHERRSSSYALKKLKIEVDEGEGYMSYGSISVDEDYTTYIRFKNPVPVKSVKFTEIEKNMADFYEIYFLR